MATLDNLALSHSQNTLWPTIADATDTYLRRYAADADSYERLWRLLHVWEAVGITLAAAAMCRLRDEPGSQALLRRCREHFYGLSWDDLTRGFRNLPAAAEGNLEQWARLLQEIASARDVESLFLRALADFLNRDSISLSNFFQAWNRLGDVPPEAFKTASFRVQDVFRYIALFRHRLTRVPFSYEPLEAIGEALETVTDQLFRSEADKATPLQGGFGKGRSVLRGGVIGLSDEDSGQMAQFIFTAKGKNENPEKWNALSFIHFDSMMRPHLLTRLRQNESVSIGEFTRFRAEANAVIEKADTQIRFGLPRPKAVEYKNQDAKQNGHAAQPGLIEALDDLRQENYDPAIAYFRELVEKQPADYPGWLRLGYARREKAVSGQNEQGEETVSLLIKAIDDLTKACQQKDPQQLARAYYERSRTYYQLDRRMLVRRGHFDLACKDAVTACKLSDEPEFQRWLQFLSADNNQTATEQNGLYQAQFR
jgi:tetratricopeptide (TPR) repeat protein